jgi:hypothetical protein
LPHLLDMVKALYKSGGKAERAALNHARTATTRLALVEDMLAAIQVSRDAEAQERMSVGGAQYEHDMLDADMLNDADECLAHRAWAREEYETEIARILSGEKLDMTEEQIWGGGLIDHSAGR